MSAKNKTPKPAAEWIVLAKYNPEWRSWAAQRFQQCENRAFREAPILTRTLETGDEGSVKGLCF